MMKNRFVCSTLYKIKYEKFLDFENFSKGRELDDRARSLEEEEVCIGNRLRGEQAWLKSRIPFFQ